MRVLEYLRKQELTVPRISRLNRVLRLSASATALAAASGPAMAQTVGGNTLGGMATRIAQKTRCSGARFSPSSPIWPAPY